MEFILGYQYHHEKLWCLPTSRTRLHFTRGQFGLPGIVVACVCQCVCPCVNHELVRAITHHPFKLGSPNLDHRCKRPWLRSLLFLFVFFWGGLFFFRGWGWGGDWPWPSRSNLTSKSKLAPFWACPCNNSSPVQAGTTKFGPEAQNTLVNIPIVLGVDWAWHVKFYLFSKFCSFASPVRLWNICETYENGVCSTS